jgi:GMP reductase
MTMILNDTKLDFSDVLFVPQRSTWDTPQHRSAVDLKRQFKFKHSKLELNCIPIIAANMDVVGTMNMAETLAEHGMLTALHKFYTQEQLLRFYQEAGTEKYAFYSMGISDEDYAKFERTYMNFDMNGKLPMICIDVANGYTEKFVSYVKKIRDYVKDNTIIMAGNVVTSEMTIEIIRAGADIVKVGIGSGSVCTTRKVAGVGYPQLSAVLECANAAHSQGGHICSDGGVVQIADIAKAFGAGADFVMCGGLFAGHHECGGELVYKSEDHIVTDKIEFPKKGAIPTHMKFRGMSSKEAMIDHYGEKAAYRAAEGKEVLVPYKGLVRQTVDEILGGLRSTCTYIGARKLKDIPKCTVFARVRQTHNTVYGE